MLKSELGVTYIPEDKGDAYSKACVAKADFTCNTGMPLAGASTVNSEIQTYKAARRPTSPVLKYSEWMHTL